MVDIRLPNINGKTTEQQMAQIRSYLYQMVEQLNWALNTIDTDNMTENRNIVVSKSDSMTELEAQSTFNAIKSLIIKSADIVTAYQEEFNKTFSGEYVAKSDFGTYMNTTMQELDISPDAIKQSFTDIQTIESDVDGINDALVDVTAHIKTGKLYEDDDGSPVYGVEVGQKDIVDGVEVFNKYARFTSSRLSFYDQNGTEVSYISDYKLYITNVVITGNIWIGKYVMDTSIGIAFKWIGG